jgi:hypothetical protein
VQGLHPLRPELPAKAITGSVKKPHSIDRAFVFAAISVI